MRADADPKPACAARSVDPRRGAQGPRRHAEHQYFMPVIYRACYTLVWARLRVACAPRHPEMEAGPCKRAEAGPRTHGALLYTFDGAGRGLYCHRGAPKSVRGDGAGLSAGDSKRQALFWA